MTEDEDCCQGCGRGCCNGCCREECSCSSFLLHHHRPVLFVRAQWPFPVGFYAGYRLLAALFWLIFIIIFIMDDYWFTKKENQAKWFIYLTNQGLLMILVSAFCQATTALAAATEFGDNLKRYDVLKSHSWFLKFQWILYNLSVGLAAPITVLYFALYLPSAGLALPPHPIDWISHIGNLAYVLLDLCITAMPMRALHFWYCSAYGLLYGIFSLLYQRAGLTNSSDKPFIYPALDWAANGGLVTGYMVLIILVVVPGCWLVLYGLYMLRMGIYYCCYPRPRPDTPSTSIEEPQAPPTIAQRNQTYAINFMPYEKTGTAISVHSKKSSASSGSGKSAKSERQTVPVTVVADVTDPVHPRPASSWTSVHTTGSRGRDGHHVASVAVNLDNEPRPSTSMISVHSEHAPHRSASRPSVHSDPGSHYSRSRKSVDSEHGSHYSMVKKRRDIDPGSQYSRSRKSVDSEHGSHYSTSRKRSDIDPGSHYSGSRKSVDSEHGSRQSASRHSVHSNRGSRPSASSENLHGDQMSQPARASRSVPAVSQHSKSAKSAQSGRLSLQHAGQPNIVITAATPRPPPAPPSNLRY